MCGIKLPSVDNLYWSGTFNQTANSYKKSYVSEGTGGLNKVFPKKFFNLVVVELQRKYIKAYIIIIIINCFWMNNVVHLSRPNAKTI